MKIRSITSILLSGALISLLSVSGKAADQGQALLNRMGGVYTDSDTFVRQELTGNSNIFFQVPTTIQMPRGRGPIGGSLGGVFSFSGQVTEARVVGRRVIYTGRLRLVVPPYSLRQATFRAVASAAGPRRESLVLAFKVSGPVPPGSILTYSGRFLGTK